MSCGIYLRCDRCGTTLGGEQVTRNPEPPLRGFQGAELRRRAAALGWVHVPAIDADLCPGCGLKASLKSF